MQARLTAVGATALFALLSARAALADDAYLGMQYAGGMGLPANMDIRSVLAGIIRSFMGFLGLYLVLRIMWGGFLLMTHGGNEEKHHEAVATIKNSVLGFLLIMMSASIAKFVIDAIANAAGQYFY